jgi:predicted Fe-Mo cluster-binding NifX family protein
MVKIVVPVVDNKGEMIGEHFGRVPYFAWFEIENGGVVDRGVVPNESEHFGGRGLPPDLINKLNPDAVVVLGMGMRAINRFQKLGVAVLQARGELVADNVDRFMRGELTELTEGCLHAREY